MLHGSCPLLILISCVFPHVGPSLLRCTKWPSGSERYIVAKLQRHLRPSLAKLALSQHSRHRNRGLFLANGPRPSSNKSQLVNSEDLYFRPWFTWFRGRWPWISALLSIILIFCIKRILFKWAQKYGQSIISSVLHQGRPVAIPPKITWLFSSHNAMVFTPCVR